MSELDEKLNSILSNPAMMQQIMSLAQALNQQPEPQQAPPPQTPCAPQKGLCRRGHSLFGRVAPGRPCGA